MYKRQVLSAVGIAANIEGIGLEAVGIVTDKGKIKTDEFYLSLIHTSEPTRPY